MSIRHMPACCWCLLASAAWCQTAQLRGVVSDDSGAVIPGAVVTAAGPRGTARSATTGSDGAYSLAGLAPGAYVVRAAAPELVLAQPVSITLHGGIRTLDLRLQVAPTRQRVTVQAGGAPAVSTEAANNASALVLRGEDLQALADDPDDLAADLQALAGPSAGPSGGALFVDGFSGGQLPPKDSIREVRINQNPFAPEYDKLGFGRIEVFTKPGSDRFRGTGYYNFGDDIWNSRNPYAAGKAPFLLKEYGGSLGGPLNRRASYTLDVHRASIDNGAIISGVTLDPATLAVINPYTGVFAVPQRRVIATPRLDYQLSAVHTLTGRYNFTRTAIQDGGVGGFNLLSRGTNLENVMHTAQVTETAVLGAHALNELRFQFIRGATFNSANQDGPALQVLGAFNGGGAPVGRSSQTDTNYEFQDYMSVTRGAHALRFGIRVRGEALDDVSPLNFAGTFTFGGGLAPVLDAANQPVRDAAGNPVLAGISSIERYRRTLLFLSLGMPAAQVRALGGGATQFAMNAGLPGLSLSQWDAGAFLGDEWRARANLTVSLGLRYEAQTNIHDGRDWAPRVALAWAPGAAAAGAKAKTVLRAGFGIFYDRFPLVDTLAARRYDGTVQRQYVIANPDFFPARPPLTALAGTLAVQAIQEVSAGMRAPYIMQSALALERQLPGNTTLALTYANSHGLHMLRSSVLPGPVFLMQSAGLYNQNQLILNLNTRVTRDVSLFGSYVYNRALSNTDGLNSFPAAPYSMAGEYGPAATDIRNRATLGGSVLTVAKVRINPLLVMGSGPPFDITVGRDLYGDTLFNARPGIATDGSRPGVVATPYGLLDPNPTPQERILPRNYGRGPGFIMLNARISREFAFGGTAEHRHTLTISLSTRNLLNHNNPGPIIGDITSPLFGSANQPYGVGTLGGTGFSESADNRRLEFQTRFTF